MLVERMFGQEISIFEFPEAYVALVFPGVTFNARLTGAKFAA